MVQPEFRARDLEEGAAGMVQDKEGNLRVDGTNCPIIEQYQILKTRIVI